MLMPDALSRAKLARASRNAKRQNTGQLILLTDDLALPDPRDAARALPPGSLVIVRARDAERRAQLALQLRAIAWARGLILLIADDPALARSLGANGIHLPERRACEAAHWRAIHPGWLITAAAHSLGAVLKSTHVDAILLSPVFATKSHAGARPLSAARARLIARSVPVAVFALGGITAQNAILLPGFAGIAAIRALAAGALPGKV
jgi:thiamine-phosphate pyrophosphorylase